MTIENLFPSAACLGLLRMQSWLSPMLPVGAFSFSHALEAAIAHGLVSDSEDLFDWLDADLRHGAGWNDAVFFNAAWRAARNGDHAMLARVAESAAAYRGTAELALEAAEQGKASLKVLSRVWPDALLVGLRETMVEDGVAPSTSVVVAVRLAGEALDLALVLPGFLQAYCSNLVAAAIRLMKLGQTAGQEIIRRIEDTVMTVARKAIASTMDDVGSSTLMIDVMSIAHETQEARLFRS